MTDHTPIKDHSPIDEIVIPAGGLQQWLVDRGRDRREQLRADWLRQARHAAKLAAGVPWPAWSSGEVLAVALILRRPDVLAAAKFTEDEALDLLAADIGADRDEAREWFADLAEEV